VKSSGKSRCPTRLQREAHPQADQASWRLEALYGRQAHCCKDALKKDPKFLAKLKGVVITRTVSLIIKPSGVQGEEIVRETNPLIVPFPKQD
jgi:hypothetical protein